MPLYILNQIFSNAKESTETKNHLGPETPGQRRTRQLSKVSTKTGMRLTGHSNTILYLILGNMQRKQWERREKICCGPEAVNQDKTEEGISRQASRVGFFPVISKPMPTTNQLTQCKPPSWNSRKRRRRAQTVLLELPASSLCFYPFPPERQILKDFSAQPPDAGWISGKRGPCPHSMGTERTLVFLWSKGIGGRVHWGK